MTFTLLMLLAGILHGLEPDHLAAISAFKAMNNKTSLVFFATRFAAGHAGIIIVASILSRIDWYLIPAEAEVFLDILGGISLITFGLIMLGMLLYGCKTLEDSHFHLVKGGRAPIAIGAAFALTSMRSLLIIVPVIIASTWVVSMARTLAFTTGIVIAMLTYGYLGDRLLQKIQGRSKIPWASYLAAAFSVVAGALVIYEHF